MDENESSLETEVEELQEEVRRLRRLNCVTVGIFLMAFPQLLMIVVFVTIAIFCAFLVSPVRGMIFSYLFNLPNRKGADFLR